jgi:glycosyltransferase involved in cell wall biosynthesis
MSETKGFEEPNVTGKMGDPPVVSVVVPLYNSARFLSATLDTILSQTFGGFEVLLVDDGSTDDTASVAERYCQSDARVRYLYKSNGGVASARNYGIAQSTGQLIALCDHDDLWSREKLEWQVPEFRDPAVGLVACGVRNEYRDNWGNVLRASVSGLGERSYSLMQLLEQNRISACTAVFRKDILCEVGGFCEDRGMHGVDDWHLWIRIACKARLVNVPKVAATHVIWGGNWSLRQHEMLNSTLYCLDQVKSLLGENRRSEQAALRHGVATAYFEFGKSFLADNELSAARNCFCHAWVRQPLQTRVIRLWLISMLPSWLRRAIKETVRRPQFAR